MQIPIIYNEYNQLSLVIPPKAAVIFFEELGAGYNDIVPDDILNDLCYQYKYDVKKRLVEKKLPGKGWEYMVYDKADRLILSQDTVLKDQGKWMITKYDQFGRVAYTGIIINNSSRQGMQDQLADSVITESRNITGFTVNGIKAYYTNVYFGVNILLSVNYYDTYPQYDFNPTFPTNILGEPTLTDNGSADGKSTKGLPVMSLVKNIEDDNWTKNYIYYDKKERTIGNYSINHLGGYTRTESLLNFSGLSERTNTYHRRLAGDVEKFITEGFIYDGQNRLLQHYHKVDNNPEVVLGDYVYNELSQLSTKSVGSGLQSIDYQYNIRGWMTKINDPKNLSGKLFGYEIKYNQVEGLETPDALDTDLKVTPKFNGNIAEVDWKTNTVQNDFLRRYGYVYDKLNRLSAGFYQRDDHPSANEYYEKIVYDLNGNITNLKRTASLGGNTTAGLIDNLSYEYFNNNNSNRLLSVTDGSTIYGGYPESSGTAIPYDANGNMTSHEDKGILQINYNFLNLPDTLKFDDTYVVRNLLGGTTETRNITTKYLFRADGTKLSKLYTYGVARNQSESYKMTDYLDGFQYEAQGASLNLSRILKFVPTAEGYYNFENNKYIYNYTDHLGNVRLSYFNNGSGAEVLEENNYYPFGLKHDGYNPLIANQSYQYRYNGKELQTESGMYDYGARMYMPDIGRWGVIDPLSEQYRRWSPYNYAVNNPIRFIDPDGMGIFDSVSTETIEGQEARDAFARMQKQWAANREDDPKKKNDRKAGSSKGMSEEDSLKEIVTIDGKKYHKNTGNLGAEIGNAINSFFDGDDDYFVEHKEYDPVLDKELKTGAEVGSYFIGGVGGKAGVRIFSEKMFINNLKKLGFKELQVTVKGYSAEMNAFFKSGGKEIVSKKALQAYKELATRIVNGAGGAPAGKITETSLKIQTQRLEMINKVLK